MKHNFTLSLVIQISANPILPLFRKSKGIKDSVRSIQDIYIYDYCHISRRNKKQQIIKQVSHIRLKMLTSFTVLALIFPKFLKMVSALSKSSSHRPIPHPSSRFIEMEFEGVESAEKHERRRKEGQTKGEKKGRRKKKKENGERKSMKRTFLANILLIGIACKQSTEIFEGTESNGL